MVLETIGAIVSRSLAIFSDVIHMFSDLLGFVFSLLAIHYSRKEANMEKTFGYVRTELLGAFASVFIIWGMSLWIGVEAI